MRKIRQDLWETEAEHPAPGLNTRAYLWSGPDGNVLFYNTSLPAEHDALAELGGVDHQYLSHQDEIGPSLRAIKERFGSALHISATEAPLAGKTCAVDGTFDRQQSEHGFEVIPTPGHTPGSACFLVPSADGKTYLFTGDTIVRAAEGNWFAGYLPGHSDRDSLAATLRQLSALTPDVVISSAFAGETGVTELDRPWADCAQEALDELLSAAPN
ncbi:MBL fold metallo-hydrolase [Saccharopolyspora griseoalba]|uniref:MBL fold metallo-hydrolase n=1 Tax=Saccharopolyspora griseoalba TaxID=1431848 RepID=A0ABW2LKB9_9PSEU